MLFELLCSVVSNLGLKLEDIVCQCYDGASNMSGKNKVLATRMEECSPKVLYVHCYGHLLNLAIQVTLSEATVLRNALRILQSLYNIIGASTKLNSIFSDVEVEESETPLTIKSISVTRWTCRRPVCARVCSDGRKTHQQEFSHHSETLWYRRRFIGLRAADIHEFSQR